jgi:hypothetical protein
VLLLAMLGAVSLSAGIGHAGSLDLTWTTPTSTVSGKPLTNLTSFRVYYGTANAGCPGATYVQVASPSPNPTSNQSLTWTLTGLAAGSAYYVGVTAVDATGQESGCATTPEPVVARGDFSVTPAGSVSFGAVSVGNSIDRTFTIQNGGSATVTGSAAVSSPFKIVAGSPYSIAAGARADVTVRFSPTAAASATSNVTFTGPGGATISRILTGTGTPAGSQPSVPSPLTVTLTAPAPGARVSGSAVILTAEATGAAAVAGVQFKVNNLNLGNEVTTRPFRLSWYTLSTPDGLHTLTAVARDAAGNVSISAPVTVTLANRSGADLTPPTLMLSAPATWGGYSTSAATVTLAGTATDNVGVTQVTWTNSRGGSGTASGTTNWTAGGIALQPGANAITLTARDAAGNARTAAITVTRTAATSLMVSLTAPVNGATVSGPAVIVSAKVSGVNVVGVQFRVDDVNLGSEVTRPPYSVSWNALSTPNGVRTLAAVVRDTAGNVQISAPVRVTLANPVPTVSLTTPVNGATVSGPAVIVTANVVGANVAGVQFRVDDVNLGSEVTRPPYRLSWNTLSTPNGVRTLAAVVRDATGTLRTSAPVRVTLANPVPTVSLTAPVNGATVSGAAVIVTANVVGTNVAGVQFRVDDVNLGSEVTTPPYRLSWNTLSTPNGVRTLRAVVRDATGALVTSAPVSVTLANAAPPPLTISLTGPLNGAIVAGPAVILTANVGGTNVAGVQFKVNNRDLGGEITSAPYRISWYTLSTPNGQHSITAVVRDAAGKVTLSSPVTVTLRN